MLTGIILLALGGFSLFVSAGVYNSDVLLSSLYTLQNFFSCSNYRYSWFGSAGPPCLFKGDGIQLLGQWAIFSALLAGSLFVAYSFRLRSISKNNGIGVRKGISSVDKMMTFLLSALIIILGSFVLFFLGDLYSNTDQFVSNLSGYRLQGWLDTGYNRMSILLAGSILWSGTTGFLSIGAVSKLNSIISKYRGSKRSGSMQTPLTSIPAKRKLMLFLISIAIVGIPIWLISNQPIREYLSSTDPHGEGAASRFFWQYSFGLIFLIDVARMCILLLVVRGLTNLDAEQRFEQAMT